MYAPDHISSVYGRSGTKLSPTLAAFVNGVAVSTYQDQNHNHNHNQNVLIDKVFTNKECALVKLFLLLA